MERLTDSQTVMLSFFSNPLVYLRVTELTSIVRLSVFYITSNWVMISDLDLGNQGHVCNMLPECDAHLCQVISKS